MTQVFRLTDGESVIDFMTDLNYFSLLPGTDLGEVPDDEMTQTRMISIRMMMQDQDIVRLWNRVKNLERMLGDAELYRSFGFGRRLRLEIRPDGHPYTTRYEVIAAKWTQKPDLTDVSHLVFNRIEPSTILLEVESYGYSDDITVISDKMIEPRNAGITHFYTAYTGGTVFGDNKASLVLGSLWQRNKFNLAPTIDTPADSDALYFGNNICAAADWNEIVLGISVAGTGTYTGVWEYGTVAGWTEFYPVSSFNDRGNSVANHADGEWRIPTDLGSIRFDGASLTSFAARTVNSVSALWIRWRKTGGTMPTVPVMMNGPVRSRYGLGYIPGGVIPGDSLGSGLIYLKNNTNNNLAEIRGALFSGMKTDEPPVWCIEAQSADLLVGTSNNPAAVQADANASLGESVRVTLSNAMTDRAIQMNGSQYITATVSGSDKIDLLGSDSFFVEVIFYADSIGMAPICLCSRWASTAGNRVFWLGIDQGKLRAMVSITGTNKYVVNGSTVIKPQTWYMATLEWQASDVDRMYLYLNGHAEGSRSVPANDLNTGVTTAIRVGKSVSFATTDSRDGRTAEVGFIGRVASVFIEGTDPVKAFWRSLGAVEDYPFPDNNPPGAVGEGQRSNYNSRVKWLLQCNDNAANTTVEDTSTTPKNGVFNVNTNTAGVSVTGYFQGGSGYPEAILGWTLPQLFSKYYPGTYQVVLAAKTSTAMSSINEFTFGLQFGQGDVGLPFHSRGKRLTDIAVPTGYMLVDLGPVTFGPSNLLHYSNPTSAHNLLRMWLYVSHTYNAAHNIDIDCIYLIPTNHWYGSFRMFRRIYNSNYVFAQNEGVIFDGRQELPVIAYVGANSLVNQKPAPYALPVPSLPRFHYNRPGYIVGLSAVGSTGTAYSYVARQVGHSLKASAIVTPNWKTLASI